MNMRMRMGGTSMRAIPIGIQLKKFEEISQGLCWKEERCSESVSRLFWIKRTTIESNTWARGVIDEFGGRADR